MPRFILLPLLLTLALALGATGCSDPTGYGDYLDKGIETIDKAKKLTAELNARTILQEFQMKRSRTPNSLDEVKKFAGQRMPEPPRGSHWVLEAGSLKLEMDKR